MGEVLRHNRWFATQGHGLEVWVAGSPLVAVELDRAEGKAGAA